MADQPVKRQTYLDDLRAKLFAKPLQGGTKRPILTFGFVTRKYDTNCAEIKIKTNVPNDADNGQIKVVVPMPDLFGYFRAIQNMATQSGKQERSFRVYATFAKGGKVDPYPAAMIHLGKEDDGRMYIAVTKKNRPNIKFYMCPDEMYRLVVNGEELTTEQTYAEYALGYIDMIRGIYQTIMDRDFVPWENPHNNGGGQRGNGGGNGGGNWNGGGNSNSGGSQSNNSYDDDVWG